MSARSWPSQREAIIWPTPKTIDLWDHGEATPLRLPLNSAIPVVTVPLGYEDTVAVTWVQEAVWVVSMEVLVSSSMQFFVEWASFRIETSLFISCVGVPVCLRRHVKLLLFAVLQRCV